MSNVLRSLTKRFMSVTLSLVLIMAMFPVFIMPVEAVTPTSNGQVWQRIQNLRQLFPNGSYFTENGNACSSNHSACSYNCYLRNVMTIRLGYANRHDNSDSHTCAATVRHAWFYVFGEPWNSNTSLNPTDNPADSRIVYAYNSGSPTGSINNALTGDVFVWWVNDDKNQGQHFGMFMGHESGIRRYFHSNAVLGPNNERRTNRVHHEGNDSRFTYDTVFPSPNNRDYILNRIVRYGTNTNNSAYNTQNTTAPTRVTFNAQGGTVLGRSTVEVITNNDRRLLMLPTPTRAGHTFNGWFTAATGGTQVQRNQQFTSSTTTIHARWTPITHTITFNHNYTGSPGNFTQTTSGANNTVALPSPAPTRTGHNFVGWFNTPNPTGGTLLTTTTPHTANATYWARWTPIVVTFNPNNGTVNPTSAQVNAQGRLTSLPVPTMTGHDFRGWFWTSSGGSTQIPLNTVYDENTTIWAQWTPTSYDVVLHRNGGTGGAPLVETTYNSNVITGWSTPTRMSS